MEITKIYTDIAILGGGCAGLIAAAAIAKAGYKDKVIIIERHARTGKKLLATGNGRCNMTNENLFNGSYFGSCGKNALKLFKKYDCTYIKAYFADMGLITRTDDEGRVYPYSNSASSVLDILRLNILKNSNTKERCNCSVNNIICEKNGYKLVCNDGVIFTKKLIIACGGKASPKLSSDGSLYKAVKNIGIQTSAVFPSLAPVKVSSPILRSVKGLRTKCSVSLLADGKKIKTESGEVQFGDGALSGICVFQLSRFVNEFFTKGTVYGEKSKKLELSIDLMPGFCKDEIMHMINKRKKDFCALNADELLTGILPKRIGQAVIKSCTSGDFSRKIKNFDDDEIKKIVKTIKQWSFEPKCISDFNNAQITAGGVKANEINFETMEAKKFKNLYFAGEIADIDGLCGGYNLHWAWVSGIIAGESAAKI